MMRVLRAEREVARAALRPVAKLAHVSGWQA
jgi:hypothetical protein